MDDTVIMSNDDLIIIRDGASYLCDASVNTEAHIAAQGWTEIAPEDLGIEDWDDLGFVYEDEAIEEATGLTQVAWDNSYNHEQDLSAQVDYRVFADPGEDYLYGPWSCIVAIRVHRGGDVRGNYRGTVLYRADDGIAGFLYGFRLGWNARDEDGDPVELVDCTQEGALEALGLDWDAEGEWVRGNFVFENGAGDLSPFYQGYA